MQGGGGASLYCTRCLAACCPKARQKIKRGTDVHLRQLAKKSMHVPSFFVVCCFFCFSAFLGASRQGEFENTRKQIECVSKKITRKGFVGEIFFPGGPPPPFFPFDFFCCVG
jgi:hypothetical protein